MQASGMKVAFPATTAMPTIVQTLNRDHCATAVPRPVQGIESVMAAQWIGDPSSGKLVFVGAAGLAEEA